jgi:hypothetical protein
LFLYYFSKISLFFLWDHGKIPCLLLRTLLQFTKVKTLQKETLLAVQFLCALSNIQNLPHQSSGICAD